MRSLPLLFLAMLTLCLGAPTKSAKKVAPKDNDPRAQQLEALKKQFPQHTAGVVTQKTDQAIRSLYFKYKEVVDQMTLASLPEDVGQLRQWMDRDLYWVDHEDDMSRSPSLRHARQQNAAWVKLKLKPYIARLESFQRGR